MPTHLTGEDLIQARVVAQLRKHGVYFHHSPNENSGTVAWRAKQKRMGVLPGVADLMIFDSPPHMIGAVGAMLELKVTGARRPPPTTQRAFLEQLTLRGWATACAFGYDAAITQLRMWGYLP